MSPCMGAPWKGGAQPEAAAAPTEQLGQGSPHASLSSHHLARDFTITFMSFPKGIKRLRHE